MVVVERGRGEGGGLIKLFSYCYNYLHISIPKLVSNTKRTKTISFNVGIYVIGSDTRPPHFPLVVLHNSI